MGYCEDGALESGRSQLPLHISHCKQNLLSCLSFPCFLEKLKEKKKLFSTLLLNPASIPFLFLLPVLGRILSAGCLHCPPSGFIPQEPSGIQLLPPSSPFKSTDDVLSVEYNDRTKTPVECDTASCPSSGLEQRSV